MAMEALAGVGDGGSYFGETEFFDDAEFSVFFRRWREGDVAKDDVAPVEEVAASESVRELPAEVKPEAVVEAESRVVEPDARTESESGVAGDEADSSAAAEPAPESSARAEGEVGEKQQGILSQIAKVALANTPKTLLNGVLGHGKSSNDGAERARTVIAADRQGLENVPTTPAQAAAARLANDMDKDGRKVETPERLRERTKIFIENWNLSRGMKLEELQESLKRNQAYLENNKEVLDSGQIADEKLRLQYIEAVKECEAAVDECERAIGQIQRDMGEHDNLTDSEWQDIMAATQLRPYVLGWYQEEQARDPEFVRRFAGSSDLERTNEFKKYLSNQYYSAVDGRDMAAVDDYDDKLELARKLSASHTPMALEELFKDLVQQAKRDVSAGEMESA